MIFFLCFPHLSIHTLPMTAEEEFALCWYNARVMRSSSRTEACVSDGSTINHKARQSSKDIWKSDAQIGETWCRLLWWQL